MKMGKITKLLMIVTFSILMLICLTGCGAKDNEVVSSLNLAIEKIDTGDYYVRTIQNTFKDNTKYKLIDADTKEFTKIPNSSSSQFGSLQKSEQLINVGASFVLIYDTETEEYYSVSVSYQSYKPVFTKATKI